jgi:hypothetical protein
LTAGPLYRLLSEPNQQLVSSWHRWIFYWIILGLVAVHIFANVLYGLVKNDPLITAMITGKKPVAAFQDSAEADIPRNVLARAVACFTAAGTIVFGTIAALGGKFL